MAIESFTTLAPRCQCCKTVFLRILQMSQISHSVEHLFACLARALGVNQFVNVKDLSLVTLCCAT
jgi:hypothetical protein